MNRRAFLARLGFGTVAAAAAATGLIDVERLLWIPGEKTIFVPTVEMADFAFVDWLARESLSVLQNRLSLVALFDRPFDQSFTASQVVNVRVPRLFHS